jgi:hypothetical protein
MCVLALRFTVCRNVMRFVCAFSLCLFHVERVGQENRAITGASSQCVFCLRCVFHVEQEGGDIDLKRTLKTRIKKSIPCQQTVKRKAKTHIQDAIVISMRGPM